MATADIDKIKLYELLLQCATSNELRDFCFRRVVVYESVVGPNDVVQIAIQKIVNYFDARGRLAELVDEAKREFPNIDWQQVYVASPLSPIEARADLKLDSMVLEATATVSQTPQSIKRTRSPGPLRIFLCHAREDKQAVRDLYQKLKEASFDPWLDSERLKYGQKWRAEIPKAIQDRDVILVCLSHQSIKSDGYIKHEIGFALDIAWCGASLGALMKTRACSVSP